MNRYKVTKKLGDGTYGSVLKAINRQTGEVVRGWLLARVGLLLDLTVFLPRRPR